MEQLGLIVYVLLSAAMVGLILLQQGKGADAGASFGSGASQTVFGSVGSGNVLTRATAILATLFFLGSIGLAMLAKNKAEELRTGAIDVPVVVESRDIPAAPATNAAGGVQDVPMLDAAAPAASKVDAGVPEAGEVPAAK